jgi:hypothetical protein
MLSLIKLLLFNYVYICHKWHVFKLINININNYIHIIPRQIATV